MKNDYGLKGKEGQRQSVLIINLTFDTVVKTRQFGDNELG